MILEVLIDVFCGLLVGALNAVNVVSLPTSGIQILGTFVSYGAHIVGADLLLVFCGCVMMWMSLKLSVGLVLFIWRLLPLT